MANPWYISEKDAAAREEAAAAQLRAVAQRCLVPGMPDDTVRAKLAARGFTAENLRRLLPLLPLLRLIHGE